MSALIWTGDSDPAAQTVTQDGVTFVKGEKTEVKDKAVYDRLKLNPMFSTDAGDTVDSDEPDAETLAEAGEAGTEKAQLKAELRAMGETVKGNPALETLRNQLAAAVKARAA